MFTDAEAMAIMTADRAMNRTVAHGQALVDAKNSEIMLLRGALAAVRRELELERARSMKLELELDAANRLLDTEI